MVKTSRRTFKKILFYLTIFLAMSGIFSKTKDEWKTRSIYQLLTDRFARSNGDTSGCNLSNYCGGTFRGIINNLDYITDMGFNAIWISPIVENTDGAYHGYHAKNIYNINPRFGSEQDFIDLINECHKRDVWVMVDVVANHVGLVGTNYGSISPFNDPSHYHDYCIINNQDFQTNQYRVENCRLADLPDLKQENDYVKNTLLDWISNMIKKYHIDGIRIDTIPEVPKWFWKLFSQRAGVYQVGEVFDGRIDYVSDYQNYIDAVLNYPLFFAMKNAFQFNGSMKQFESTLQNVNKSFKDPTILGVFVNNHDNSRFLHNNGNINKFKNSIVFSLLTSGIPIFYYGDEQKFSGGDDPNNREPLWGRMDRNSEIYQIVKKINNFRGRNNIWNLAQVQRYADDIFYAFTRGNIFVAFTNQDYDFSRPITYHPYLNGTKLCNIFNNNDNIYVNNNQFTIYMSGGNFKIYEICGTRAEIGILAKIFSLTGDISNFLVSRD